MSEGAKIANMDTIKFEAEIAQIIANSGKLSAETAKLIAEAGKLQREARWYPAIAVTAFVAAAAAIAKLFTG